MTNNYDRFLQTFENIVADQTVYQDTLGTAKGFWGRDTGEFWDHFIETDLCRNWCGLWHCAAEGYGCAILQTENWGSSCICKSEEVRGKYKSCYSRVFRPWLAGQRDKLWGQQWASSEARVWATTNLFFWKYCNWGTSPVWEITSHHCSAHFIHVHLALHVFLSTLYKIHGLYPSSITAANPPYLIVENLHL